MQKKLKVALVHDYLREYGGAERVVEKLHEIFPEAPLYTAFMDKAALGIHAGRFDGWDIRESCAAGIPFIKKLYSPLRLFSSYFFEKFDLSEYDVVISSTNMYMAKAVLTKPEALHISYIHTPPRSLYGYNTASNWKRNWVTRIFGEILNFRMRQIDFLTAQRPDVLVANSQEVQRRIHKYYRRDSVVIYPPVRTAAIARQGSPKSYLSVGRLVYAKHPEIAVGACTTLGLPLNVVGSGPLSESLQQLGGKSVKFLGPVSDEQLEDLYADARALLLPIEDEDFGIVAVEAMMHGVPVIAHNSGGVKETVREGVSGTLFDDLTQAGLVSAIRKFETMSFDTHKIYVHAQQFSSESFKAKLVQLINTNYPVHRGEIK